MKHPARRRWILYVALLGAMAYSALQLDTPLTQKAAAFYFQCCSFGTDCTNATHVCCNPPNTLPCSQAKAGYCMTNPECRGQID